jgi:DNA-binding transcriptional LysR family regulator
MRFDWTDLRVFLNACDSGSMTEAASRSNLTLAAVSARIRGLEESAGVSLLRRHARGVVATAAGHALARHARLLFHQLDALRRDVAAPGPTDMTSTVLLANSSAMSRPLSRVIGDVLGSQPGLRVMARESSSEVTVHALHAGTADVGLVTDAVNTDGLIAARLGADPLVLVASPEHVLAARGAIQFDEALVHDWVGWGEASALHTHLLMRAYQAGAALKLKASIPSADGVLDLVARGIGVSVLPRALLGQVELGQRIAIVELAETWAQRQLLVCRAAETRSPMAGALFSAFAAQWGEGSMQKLRCCTLLRADAGRVSS